MDKTDELVQQRKNKISELIRQGTNPFPNDFKPGESIGDILKAVEKDPEKFGEEGPAFSAAGRIMAINRMGKAAFVRFQDRSGRMQAYIRKDRVGDDAFALFKKIDIGDFIGLEGPMFQTRTGEWTLLAGNFRLITKSVRPLPEKFHGLKDAEKRYRKRYVDLIVNNEVKELFIRRSRIIQTIRNFLLDRDFLEVETPMMQAIPGGAEATPFKTHHNSLGMDLFLRIAPELYLKRLVVGGFERVFEINRNFRNEGISTRHNPEFTMMEFYQAYATYEDLMDLTEDLFLTVTKNVLGGTSFPFNGETIEVAKPWRRLTMASALETIGGIDPSHLNDREKLLAVAEEKGVKITKKQRLGKIITKLFDALVEPKLIQPTFITGYPVEVSPLSRKNDDNPDLTDRFELFIAGYEIANGFSELNDPADQEARFLQQVADRDAGDQEAHMMDRDYVEALEYGMPPTAGEGIGIDRLAMLLTDSQSIREVILFPHMKPTEG